MVIAFYIVVGVVLTLYGLWRLANWVLGVREEEEEE